MIRKWLIDSSYKLVNEVILRLMLKTHLKICNNDEEQISSLKENIYIDMQSDIYLLTEHKPIALEQLTMSMTLFCCFYC